MEEISCLCWKSKPTSSFVQPVIISTGSSRHLSAYGDWNIIKIWSHFHFFCDFRGPCGLIFELGYIWKVFCNSPILDFSVFLTILYANILLLWDYWYLMGYLFLLLPPPPSPLHWLDSLHQALHSSIFLRQLSPPMLVSSIILYLAATRSPSWYCFPILVEVFPRVFLHGIVCSVFFQYFRIIHSDYMTGLL